MILMHETKRNKPKLGVNMPDPVHFTDNHIEKYREEERDQNQTVGVNK